LLNFTASLKRTINELTLAFPFQERVRHRPYNVYLVHVNVGFLGEVKTFEVFLVKVNLTYCSYRCFSIGFKEHRKDWLENKNLNFKSYCFHYNTSNHGGYLFNS